MQTLSRINIHGIIYSKHYQAREENPQFLTITSFNSGGCCFLQLEDNLNKEKIITIPLPNLFDNPKLFKVIE